MSHYWLERHLAGAIEESYDYACFVEPWLMDRNLAPHRANGTPAVTYAWHFDAQLLADYLKRYGIEQLGVRHRLDRMVGAERDGRGFITALRTKSGVPVEGDLFVDCSGFRGALINQVLAEPFLDQLTTCSAIARWHDRFRMTTNGPASSPTPPRSRWNPGGPGGRRCSAGSAPDTSIPVTSSTTTRPGSTSAECGASTRRASSTRSGSGSGVTGADWVNNCVSIGLSSCFLEPLESSGLYFTYAAIYQLAKHFPTLDFEPALIDSFNEEIAAMYDETRDFLQAHFYFSPRADTEFWRANKQLRLSAEIEGKIAKYLAGLPINPPITDESTYYANFDAEFRNFWTNGSYYAILSGLGVNPPQPLPAMQYRADVRGRSEELFRRMRARRELLLAELPTTYDYLNTLHRSSEHVH